MLNIQAPMPATASLLLQSLCLELPFGARDQPRSPKIPNKASTPTYLSINDIWCGQRTSPAKYMKVREMGIGVYITQQARQKRVCRMRSAKLCTSHGEKE